MASVTVSSPPESAADSVREIAGRLCPVPVRTVAPAGGGGNSRLYRVEAADAVYALKSYPSRVQDPRDRLSQEFAALSFVSRHDPECRVPVPVAADVGFGLYEWIEGTPVGRPGPDDIDAVLAFARRLHDLRAEPAAGALAFASEACLSLAEIGRQVTRRHRRLAEVADGEPELRAYLDDGFAPTLARALERARGLYRDAGLDSDADIEAGQRTLSPSDFGFHNALRRPDGRLAFLDFEYFGWDDPVRLAADFQWHPGMALDEDLKRRFAAGTNALFSIDPHYRRRLAAQWPLVGLRWCMILLNEFLPERWLGRVHAGQGRERREVLSHQLSKARRFLEKVEESMRMPAVTFENSHGRA